MTGEPSNHPDPSSRPPFPRALGEIPSRGVMKTPPKNKKIKKAKVKNKTAG